MERSAMMVIEYVEYAWNQSRLNVSSACGPNILRSISFCIFYSFAVWILKERKAYVALYSGFWGCCRRYWPQFSERIIKWFLWHRPQFSARNSKWFLFPIWEQGCGYIWYSSTSASIYFINQGIKKYVQCECGQQSIWKCSGWICFQIF